MKKISRKDFQGLQEQFPVLTKEEMKCYVGGDGYGYSGDDWLSSWNDWLDHGYYFEDSSGFHWYKGYSRHEFDNWSGPWYGGWVGGLGYVQPDWSVYPGSGEFFGDLYLGELTSIYTVLSSEYFSGFQATQPSGCLERCKEMLAYANVRTVGDGSQTIKMVSNSNGTGSAGDAISSTQLGIDTINEALNNGDPIIVGVDYKSGYANNDQITDHWIVIVGRTVTDNGSVQYNYYDPQATSAVNGTSSRNILTLTAEGKLQGTYRAGTSYENDYTVSAVRPNL